MSTLLSTAETKEELEQDLQRTGHTMEEFVKALTTVSSYAITFAINELRLHIAKMNTNLRGNEHCDRRGFKMELNGVVAAMNALTTLERTVIIKDLERIMIMQKEEHEYMTGHLQKMYYSCYNWLGRYHFMAPDIMADVMIAIALADMVDCIIDSRIEEVTPYHQSYICCSQLKPTKIKQRLQELATAIERCYPGADDCDFNECVELHTGVNAIKAQIFDLDLMELHCAFGLQQTMGDERLKKLDKKAYKLLHLNYNGE